MHIFLDFLFYTTFACSLLSMADFLNDEARAFFLFNNYYKNHDDIESSEKYYFYFKVLSPTCTKRIAKKCE